MADVRSLPMDRLLQPGRGGGGGGGKVSSMNPLYETLFEEVVALRAANRSLCRPLTVNIDEHRACEDHDTYTVRARWNDEGISHDRSVERRYSEFDTLCKYLKDVYECGQTVSSIQCRPTDLDLTDGTKRLSFIPHVGLSLHFFGT